MTTGVTTGTTTTDASIMSKMASNKYNIGIIFAGLLFVSLFIAAFVQMSNFIGSKDDWNTLKPQITKIIVLVLIGIFAFIIASLMYFIQDPQKAIYFTIVTSGLSIGLAFMALAIAAISR
jgi:hypothetical protein